MLAVLAWAVVAAPPALAAEESAPAGEEKAKVELKTFGQKLSYVVGLQIGRSLTAMKKEIELEFLVHGLRDSLEGNKPLLSKAEESEIQGTFMKKMHEARLKEQKAAGGKNLEEGQKFLAENGKQKGIVTTDSGLQYQVLTEGKGPKAKATDRVKVHYRGTLLDGTEFDSSYSRNQPATFPVGGVIKGWTEALQLMSVGSKYKLFIPSELAYGPRGSPPRIGPNSVLIFEVELLDIE
jgi:FKBP-type peptidyl-prolyl cis-trans isomerase FkpA/FKBP-type peptidyl-prolyl cis-trans isomerase FklB